MVDGNISGGGYNLPAIQFTRDGGNQFELTTNCPRTKELEDFSTLYSSSSFERDDVLSELASSLQEANIQNENIIQQLLSQLTKLETQLQSQSKSIKAKIDGLKEKHVLAEKVLNQFSSHNEAIKDPPARSHDSNNRHDQLRRQNYEILEKITRSTYDNGQLLAQCHKHEEEGSQHQDLNVVAKELEEENEGKYDLMNGISDKLMNFTRAHEDCIQCYEAQLASLKVEKNQAVSSKEELNTTWLGELKEQKKEVKKLKRTSEVLHQNIDLPYDALEESKVSDEIGSVENETRNEREIKLAKLKLKRVTWVDDNDNYRRSQKELPHILALRQDEDNSDEE